METYHKIKTLFNRDEQTKKLIIGDYRDKTIEYLKDNIWEFTEKVDGTNIRVCWDGYKVKFAGRTDNANIPSRLLERLTTLFGGETNEQIFEQKFGEKEVILFGEGYGGKIQKGYLYRNNEDFVLFDVKVDGVFLQREAVENIAKCFNIDVVPILLRGTLHDGVDYVTNYSKKSVIAQNNAPLEGIVGRTLIETNDRLGNRNIVKIKYCDFKE